MSDSMKHASLNASPNSRDEFPVQDEESTIGLSREQEEAEEKQEQARQEREHNGSKEPIQVQWAPDDPENPYNWSPLYKTFVTFLLGMLALSASVGSSITSPAQNTLSSVFGISREVAVLNISLYILGFAFGPLLWAPISEIWGRRWSILPAMFCLACFSIATAVSQNAETYFVARFFAGLFGSAPVGNVSAALGDFYIPEQRGPAINAYACIVVGGPTLGPLIGSAIFVNSNMGWRWTAYILAIWAFSAFLLAAFFLPEVYGPVLLARKAKKMREETGDKRWFHPHERMELSFKAMATKHFSRPLKMLTTEPMVMSIAFYASFVYSLLYMTIEFFPIVYAEERGWAPVPASLPFIGLFVGVLAAIKINNGNQKRYKRKSQAAGGVPVPEARCPPMIVGAFLFSIGMFWFGWTASPKQGVHWASSVVAAGFIGAGFNTIFQQCINALVDTYGIYAASAVSGNTFLRSVLAAVLPLVARPMFGALGVGPAMSILGGISVFMIPVPFILMRYGRTLRLRSKFARELEKKRSGGG